MCLLSSVWPAGRAWRNAVQIGRPSPRQAAVSARRGLACVAQIPTHHRTLHPSVAVSVAATDSRSIVLLRYLHFFL